MAQEVFAKLLQQSDISIVVCEFQESLVATCMLATISGLANGVRPFALIEHVVIFAAYRGHGFARMALECALELAWSMDCYKVVLLSGMQRAGAHRLYESVCFNGSVERGFVAKPNGV